MKTTKQLIACALACAIATLPAVPAHATAVIAATEPTQILNNIQLLGSYAKHVQTVINQATQIYNQIEAYKNMIQNTKNLVTADIQKLTSTLSSLKSIVTSAKGLSYAASSVSSNFKSTHKGYADFEATLLGVGGFEKKYRDWQNLHEETTTSALEELKLQEDDFKDEDTTISTIQSKLITTDGQVEATVMGSQIALQQINQLQMLRKLVMNDTQTKTRYAAIESEKQQLQAAESAKISSGSHGAIGGEKTF